MDADSNHGCHERIMLLRVNEHAMQAIIIENTVVDAFRGGALFIDLLISICAPGEIGVKPYIPIRVGFDDPAIFGIRTGVFTFGTMIFSIGAAPHKVTAGLVKPIWLHAQLFLAQGSPVFVNGDGVRNCFRPSTFAI